VSPSCNSTRKLPPGHRQWCGAVTARFGAARHQRCARRATQRWTPAAALASPQHLPPDAADLGVLRLRLLLVLAGQCRAYWACWLECRLAGSGCYAAGGDRYRWRLMLRRVTKGCGR
jgi:hypothetical protein